MNHRIINIITAAVAVLAIAGCTATPPVHSHDAPIMSAADARAMIRVEVKVLEPGAAEPVIVAAAAK